MGRHFGDKNITTHERETIAAYDAKLAKKDAKIEELNAKLDKSARKVKDLNKLLKDERNRG